MAMAPPSGTVTFLFTDIEGSTQLWEAAPDAMRASLSWHDSILRDAIEAHSGYVFATGGDGFAAAFARAGDALIGAEKARTALANEEWPVGAPIRVRMALHTGETTERDGNYFGGAVNRAARLMAISHGGQLLVSAATAELLTGVELLDLGEHRLRDLAAPMRVFQVGPGEFEALRSLDAFPSNLPAQPGTFVGRTTELAEVVEALERSHVVTLTGVGGVGKTRLALQAAAELLPRFRDGAWLVELAPVVDPDALVEVVARALDVPERQGQPLAASLTDFLRAKRLLMVLDNCEHLLDAVALFVGGVLAACPEVSLVATSREGLRVRGERIVVVPSLGLPPGEDADAVAEADAVRLFVERAVEAKGRFELSSTNAAAVARLVRRLDGIPLALELAAARVRSLTPAELADRLDERFRLLAGGQRTAVERHQTLRRAIDWSYELLTPAEQVALNRTAVFVGDFGLDSAEVVLAGDGVEDVDVVDLLGHLVDKSLVIAEDREGATRYRMLETIRQYAQERLEAAGEADRLRNRHADHFADFAARAGDGLRGRDEAAWTERFDAELDNVRAAVSWAIGTGDADLALRIIGPLVLNGTRAGYAAGAWAESAAAMPGAEAHPLYPQVLSFSGWATTTAGDRPAGIDICTRALAAAERLGVEGRALCRVLASATGVYAFQYGSEEIGPLAERWVETARSAGDDYELTQALDLASLPFAAAGDYAAATSLTDEAVAVARRSGSASALCYALFTSGSIHWTTPAQALPYLEQALLVAEEVGNQLGSGIALALTAVVLGQQGDWVGAAPYVARSIRNYYRAGDRNGFDQNLQSVALILEATGDDQGAATLFGTQVTNDTATSRRGQNGSTPRRLRCAPVSATTSSRAVSLEGPR
jgi:predicted ATPase/class 3 adenylate cyclase